MGEFEYSLTIQAAPDELFAFVANVESLPSYLPAVRHADSPSHGRVRVRGTFQGQPYEVEGYILADYELRRLEWGTDGAWGPDRAVQYRGWLQVIGPDGTTSSRLTVHLSFSQPVGGLNTAARYDGERDPAISGALEQAVRSIQRIVERRAAKARAER